MKVFNSIRKYGTLPAATGLVSVAMAVPAFASDAAAASPTDWANVITALTSQISISTIMGALVTFVAAGIGIVFTWWGSAKVSAPLCPPSAKVGCQFNTGLWPGHNK